MIMGAFIPGLRRKYPFHEYISALLLVVGLILFTLADAQTSPNFSIIGIIMISGALIMDAFLGNFQEAIFTMNPDTTQVCHKIFSFLFETRTITNKVLTILCLHIYSFSSTDGDVVLLNSSWNSFLTCTNDSNRRTR